MSQDDPLRAMVARHLDRRPAVDRTVVPSVDPATISRICDYALTTLSAVTHLLGTAEMALLLQRQRLVAQLDERQDSPTGRIGGPIRIPIRLSEADTPSGPR